MPEDEERCPDCDAVAVLPIYSDRGNGQCSECHGTGEGGIFEDVADSLNPLYSVKSECDKCHGSGICRTCGGSGVI